MPIATAPPRPIAASAAQRAARDGGAQRPAVQLVEAVRGDADGEAERRQRRHQPAAVERRGEGGADRDVRQVPGRVGQVQERDVVAPAAGCERVERGRALSPHAGPRARSRRPTTSAGSGRRRSRHARTPPPAPAAGSARWNAHDARAQELPDVVPGGCDQAAGERQADAGVEVPEPAQRAARRQRELQVAERRTRLQHPRQPGQGGVDVVDVAQQVGEREAVERRRRRTAAPRPGPRPASRRRRAPAVRSRAPASIPADWSRPVIRQP